MTTATEPSRSLGTIVKELTSDLSTLFRSEVTLLKMEVKQTTTKLSGGIALFAAALFCGLFGLAFLLVTAILGLVALGVPAWLSGLILTVLLFGAAVVLGLMGKKKFAAVQFLPAESMEKIRTDIETIKADVVRDRSRS